ncbi:translation initiation factor IF-2-like [Gallus gallus]|uniref:translation initiation factor IF-2-like n=1 Tax=Gallus gallus TaxID=9031 RepID=UPI001AE5E881|nr:translation initiation factor IF-2-like [Gallus gallus]
MPNCPTISVRMSPAAEARAHSASIWELRAPSRAASQRADGPAGLRSTPVSPQATRGAISDPPHRDTRLPPPNARAERGPPGRGGLQAAAGALPPSRTAYGRITPAALRLGSDRTLEPGISTNPSNPSRPDCCPAPDVSAQLPTLPPAYAPAPLRAGPRSSLSPRHPQHLLASSSLPRLAERGGNVQHGKAQGEQTGEGKPRHQQHQPAPRALGPPQPGRGLPLGSAARSFRPQAWSAGLRPVASRPPPRPAPHAAAGQPAPGLPAVAAPGGSGPLRSGTQYPAPAPG